MREEEDVGFGCYQSLLIILKEFNYDCNILYTHRTRAKASMNDSCWETAEMS